MERASAEQKKKGATAKRVKAKNRLAAHVNSCEALKRGQRYLGLRPLDRKGGLPLPDSSLSWEEKQSFEREQKIKYGHILQFLDVEKPAPYTFDRDVIFLSVDVESYERNHDLITEIGISTLDTADIKTAVPGHGGFNWMERIRSRHFRISNHAHLRNTTFCAGNPEKFLFGRSEFVSMNEIGRVVDSCFEPPYSADFMHDGGFRPQDDKNALEKTIVDHLQCLSFQVQKPGDGMPPTFQCKDESVNGHRHTDAKQDLLNKAAISSKSSPELQEEAKVQENPKHRNIILVGHDLDGDLRYLSMVQSKMFHQSSEALTLQSLDSEYTPILESLDTANLYQVWKREANITSLAKVIYGVERTGWELHNAGNDARYTLEALIGILLGARVEDGSKINDDETERELQKRVKDRQDAVERQERENAAMWKHAMGDYGDNENGGVLLDHYQPASNFAPATAAERKENQTDCPLSQGKLDPEAMKSLQDGIAAPPDQSSSELSTSVAAETQPEHYPWSSCARATLDGGEPKAFQMPAPKSEKGKSKSLSRRREMEEKLRVLEEGI